MAKTQAQRTQAYYERQKEAGRVQMKIWVPNDEDLKKKIRDYAKKKIREYNRTWEIPD